MSCFSCLFGDKRQLGLDPSPAPAPQSTGASASLPKETTGSSAPAVNAAKESFVEDRDAGSAPLEPGAQTSGVTQMESLPQPRDSDTGHGKLIDGSGPVKPSKNVEGSSSLQNGSAVVQKTPSAASQGASVAADRNSISVVVGEVGVVGGQGSFRAANFQARATPRTVFGQSAQVGGAQPASLAPKAADGSPRQAARPDSTAHNLNGVGNEHRAPTAQEQAPKRRLSDEEPHVTIVGGMHSSTLVPDGDTSAGEVEVRDGDKDCRPGTAVMISSRWAHVAYFKPFAGLQGVLTRRGPHGGTWYACFPGSTEHAFSTGMHGQHVLSYSTLGSPHSPLDVSRSHDFDSSTQPPPVRPAALGYADMTAAFEQSPFEPSGATRQAMKDAKERQEILRSELQEQVQGEASTASRSVVKIERATQAAAENAAQALQPKNKDAVNDASLAVATDAPLAAPRGGKQSSRGPLSHRGAGRPVSARSRSQMGAPPLGSARLNSVRSRGSYITPRITGLRPADALSELDDRPGREGRLFKYPEWDEYDLFDSDDLWSEHAYLLYGESTAPGQHPSVFVWIGQYFEECNYMDQAECESFAARATRDFQRLFGRVPVGPIYVVKELQEDEDFWEYFVLG